jgi:pimeloyl-ACP methyl ester carboxylesterase
MPDEIDLVEPTLMQDGLAMYAAGDGDPVLLMPYPHGFPVAPIIQGRLAKILIGLNRCVLTFAPPGAFHSTRPARVDMAEMLGCARETLAAFEIRDPLPVIGHSMGGLCALALTLDYPDLVSALVMANSISGFPAIRRAMPWGWKWTDPDLWRYMWLGLRTSLGFSNLAAHKRMRRLLWESSYVNESLAPALEILPDDHKRPAPVRNRWTYNARKYDYAPRLGAIHVPTLILAGRHDPQAPVECSEELAAGIPGARLVVFEQSGHYAYTEEEEAFAEAIGLFLGH